MSESGASPVMPRGSKNAPEFPRGSEAALRDLMWQYCGIIRNQQGLETALAELDRVAWAPVRNPGLQDFETRNLYHVGALIARAALRRQESRGAHFRSDYPEKKAAAIW
jgi:L-aspartate oxidase